MSSKQFDCWCAVQRASFLFNRVTLSAYSSGTTTPVRQRRRLVSAGGLIYLRPRLTGTRVPGVSRRGNTRVKLLLRVFPQWYRIVHTEVTFTVFRVFFQWKGFMHQSGRYGSLFLKSISASVRVAPCAKKVYVCILKTPWSPWALGAQVFQGKTRSTPLL